MAEAAVMDQVKKTARRDFADLVIEIDDERNGNLMFNPAQDRLRGRWDSKRLPRGSQSAAGLLEMPVIPGCYVKLSLRDRTATIEDPLNYEENATLLTDVRKTHRTVFSQDTGPRLKTQPHERLKDNDLATWLYWMMRAVQEKCATVVSGRIPDSEGEIREILGDVKIRRIFGDPFTPLRRQQDEGVPFGATEW